MVASNSDTLEVLACLPKEPLGASALEITVDVFGRDVPTYRDSVYRCISSLRKAGIRIHKTSETRGDDVCGYGVGEESWEQAKAMLVDWTAQA